MAGSGGCALDRSSYSTLQLDVVAVWLKMRLEPTRVSVRDMNQILLSNCKHQVFVQFDLSVQFSLFLCRNRVEHRELFISERSYLTYIGVFLEYECWAEEHLAGRKGVRKIQIITLEQAGLITLDHLFLVQ